MTHNDDETPVQGALHTPVRNHYYHGKLLDAGLFSLEQRYFNSKRALINRFVVGYGVVCGLDLYLLDTHDQVIVTPGLAIDKWGREIVVPKPSAPIRLRRLPNAPHEEEEWVYLCLTYHECESDPKPVLTADCPETGPCAPDVIQERYQILVRPGRVPEPPHECTLHEAITTQGIKFPELALWVSQECAAPPADPCIPLGDIFIPEDGRIHQDDVHVDHRPIVYSNDMLYELILGLTEELLKGRRGKYA